MKISRSDPGGITTYYTSQLVISRSSETLKDHIFKDCKNLQRSVVKVTVMLTITCSNLKALTPAKTHILKLRHPYTLKRMEMSQLSAWGVGKVHRVGSRNSKGHNMLEIRPGIRHIPETGIPYLSISPGRHLRHSLWLCVHSFPLGCNQRKGKQLFYCCHLVKLQVSD